MVKKVLDDAPAQETGAAEDRHLSGICHLAHDRATGPPVCAARSSPFSRRFYGRSMAIGRKRPVSQVNQRFRLCSKLMEFGSGCSTAPVDPDVASFRMTLEGKRVFMSNSMLTIAECPCP